MAPLSLQHLVEEIESEMGIGLHNLEQMLLFPVLGIHGALEPVLLKLLN